MITQKTEDKKNMDIENCIRNINKVSSELRFFQAENMSSLSDGQREDISLFLADAFIMSNSLMAVKAVSEFNVANGISPVCFNGDAMSSDLFNLYCLLINDGQELMAKMLSKKNA